MRRHRRSAPVQKKYRSEPLIKFLLFGEVKKNIFGVELREDKRRKRKRKRKREKRPFEDDS